MVIKQNSKKYSIQKKGRKREKKKKMTKTSKNKDQDGSFEHNHINNYVKHK